MANFSAPFESDNYSKEESSNLSPFFTNLDKPVYVPLIFAPELIGALCSRTSRAKGDLRKVFLEEYLKPFLQPERGEKETDKEWAENLKHSEVIQEFVAFIKKHPLESIFSNPRARSFYAKWLAQYGDDSIAQMAGAHVVFSGISQLAIKHFQDQRIGLAPIEKSTRYVDYSVKVNNGYMYYTDPTLAEHGLEKNYKEAMDGLFETYIDLLPKLQNCFKNKFPDEKKGVIEKKAFDTLRGLLPVATLSQVAFFGNGQAFEYMIARSLKSRLGEVRWAANETYNELFKLTPAFIRRVKDETGQTTAADYQEYMAGRQERVSSHTPSPTDVGTSPPRGAAPVALERSPSLEGEEALGRGGVKLLEHDPEGENKIIAGILYNADSNSSSWENTLKHVESLSDSDKNTILEKYLAGRSQRWQKVGRAFENTYVRFEILMNIGSWRDLHRHRMLTQQRQLFTVNHGYDLPQDVVDAGLAPQYQAAVAKAEEVFHAIADKDPVLAQYAVTLAHRVRFQQWKNLRECFWEMELRTIPEGHPDYRTIEQEKFRLLEEKFPLITKHMMVNVGDYDFARRGQTDKIQSKLEALEKI